MYRTRLVDGKRHTDFRVEGLLDAAEGETHFRKALVADPFLGDRPHLGEYGERLVLQGCQFEVDAFLLRPVDRRSDVLPRFAFEGQCGQVDDGVLGDLQSAPAHLAGDLGRCLTDREPARDACAALGHVGELADRLGQFLRSADGVREGDDGAGRSLVADHAFAVLGERVLIVLPGDHPAHGAAAISLEEAAYLFGRIGSAHARHGFPATKRDVERIPPGEQQRQFDDPQQTGTDRDRALTLEVGGDHRDQHEDEQGDVQEPVDHGDPPCPAPSAPQLVGDQQHDQNTDDRSPAEAVVGIGGTEGPVAGKHGDSDVDDPDEDQAEEADHPDLLPRSRHHTGFTSTEELFADHEHHHCSDEVGDVMQRALEEKRNGNVGKENRPHPQSPRRAESGTCRRHGSNDGGGMAHVLDVGEMVDPFPAGRPEHSDERDGTELADQLPRNGDNGDPDRAQQPLAPSDHNGEDDDEGDVVSRCQPEEGARQRSPPLTVGERGIAIGDITEPGPVLHRLPQRSGDDAENNCHRDHGRGEGDLADGPGHRTEHLVGPRRCRLGRGCLGSGVGRAHRRLSSCGAGRAGRTDGPVPAAGGRDVCRVALGGDYSLDHGNPRRLPSHGISNFKPADHTANECPPGTMSKWTSMPAACAAW